MDKQRKRIPVVSWILLLLMPPVILCLSQLITMQSADAFVWVTEHLCAMALGWVLLLLAGCVVLGITGRLWLVWVVTAVPCTVLTLINLFKTQINGFPLLIGDFTLVRQFGEIAAFAAPQMKVSLLTALAVLLIVVILVLLIVFGKPLKARGKGRAALAIFGVAAAAVLLLSGGAFAWAERAEGDSVMQEERIKSCGVLVGLFSAWAGTFDEPVQISSEEILEQIGNLQPVVVPELEDAPEPVGTPSVIFLMSESFFDITEMGGLEFESDPLPNFHRIEETFSSGAFVSNTYSGGTGYAEMEVLTGLCSFMLKESDTLTSLPAEKYAALPCVADVFSQNGYRKEFIHSYNNQLYNRANIYESFGFDAVRFDDSFPEDAERAGGYISDLALAKEIITSYENKGDGPLMLFAVSMENHQPYTLDKYDAPCEAGLSSNILTADELAYVDIYANGLMHADQALGYLTDYFAEQDEPVMIVFWGDHLPNLNLPDGTNIYYKLGRNQDLDTTAWDPETLMNMLSTDYVIWTNYGLPEQDATVGATMFGLHVLDLLGFELSDYYLWLHEYVYERYVMYRPRLFVNEEGVPSAAVPEAYQGMIDSYAAVVYDIVYGDNQIFPNSLREPQQETTEDAAE